MTGVICGDRLLRDRSRHHTRQRGKRYDRGTDSGEDPRPADRTGPEARRRMGVRSNAQRETASAAPGDHARALGGLRFHTGGEGAERRGCTLLSPRLVSAG